MTVEEKFAYAINTKRKAFLVLAKSVRAAVHRERERGRPIGDWHRMQEVLAERYEKAAEALGQPTLNGKPLPPPSAWQPAGEGKVHCTTCKQDISDVAMAKARHIKSKKHRDSVALLG